ncbi:MAG: DUF2335 domain-containing protein [Selenomonadaceae bacterium]|nr:DUF2335 domain-containing protein [Selenomonadaceae bacterium]
MADDERSVRQIKTLETTITQTIESPYPPSSELEGYERVLPGAAERIFALVEAESQHRRELEKAALQKESRDSLIGFAAAFIVAMSATVGGGFLVYSGYPVAGSIFGLSGVASIVGAFLKTSSKPSNRDDNAD